MDPTVPSVAAAAAAGEYFAAAWRGLNLRPPPADAVWPLPALAAWLVAFVALYMSVFAVGVAILPPSARRKRSWLLTLVSSIGTSTGGLYFAARVLRGGVAALQAEDAAATDGGLGVLLILFFAVYLVLDLVVGSLCYREQITVLSGWVHHTVYLGVAHWALNNNATALLSAFFVSEIPTVIMALGQLNAALRNDLAFGASYFVTRLVYHGYLLALWLAHWARGWSVVAGTLALHVYWFYSWVQSQRRRGWFRPTKVAAKHV